MLIDTIHIDVTTQGIGCVANILVTRGRDRVIVPVVQYVEFQDVQEYEIIAVTNQALKRFFDLCQQEYSQHIITDRDKQRTIRYLGWPLYPENGMKP